MNISELDVRGFGLHILVCVSENEWLNHVDILKYHVKVFSRYFYLLVKYFPKNRAILVQKLGEEKIVKIRAIL